MKKLTVGMLLIALSLIHIGVVSAEEKEKSPAELDPAALEKLFQEFATPGEAHKFFNRLVGVWETESKSYMADPKNPTVSHGTSEFRLLMDGRYVQQVNRGKFDGMKFEGIGITGFDNSKKKYVGIWIDNFGTGIMHSEGEFDEETKTMTEIAEGTTPLGKMRMKLVGKYNDDDKFIVTMYMLLPDDKEQLQMEFTYTRAKQTAK